MWCTRHLECFLWVSSTNCSYYGSRRRLSLFDLPGMDRFDCKAHKKAREVSQENLKAADFLFCGWLKHLSDDILASGESIRHTQTQPLTLNQRGWFGMAYHSCHLPLCVWMFGRHINHALQFWILHNYFQDLLGKKIERWVRVDWLLNKKRKNNNQYL